MAWNSANIAFQSTLQGKPNPTMPNQSLFKGAGMQVMPSYLTYYKLPDKQAFYVPTQTYTIPRMDLSWFTDSFASNFTSFFGYYTEYFARMIIRKFAETAAKYSPPNIGKATIDQKYYFRPVYNLIDMSKGKVLGPKGKPLHCTKEDYAAMRRGMKFKVMNTKYRVKKGTVYAYTKGINEAKRLSRIENRGLTKYSWGTMINTYSSEQFASMNDISSPNYGTAFGVPSLRKDFLTRKTLIETELPPIFRRLESKSPNIKKYRWGYVEWTENRVPNPGGTGANKFTTKGNNIKLNLKNNLAEVEKYCQIAIRQGIYAASRETNKLIGYIQKGAKEKIEKMFDFDIKRVQQVTAFGIIKQRKK